MLCAVDVAAELFDVECERISGDGLDEWTCGPPVDYEECEEASNVVLALVGLGWMPKLIDTLGLDPSVYWSARPERFEILAF